MQGLFGQVSQLTGSQLAAQKPTGLLGTAGRVLAPAGRALAPVGRVLAPAGRALAPVGRVLAPVGRVLAPVGSAAAAAGQVMAGSATSVAGKLETAFKGGVTALGGQTTLQGRIAGWGLGVYQWFRSLSWTTTLILLFLFISIIIVGILWWTGVFSPAADQEAKAETTAAALNAKVATTTQATATKTTEGFQQQQQQQEPAPAGTKIDQHSANLLNLQPMTIKQAGFLGPAAADGKFDPELAVGQALRAGFRSFVLQIDYLDSAKDRSKFAAPGMPTLLYKNASGALVSANSGSIQAVARTIAAQAFSPEVPNGAQPVLLYLHVVRTPSPVRQPELYVRFLSQIAKELSPIAPNHLGMTPLGAFHRQKNEETLFTAPISTFEGQVIVMSNVDTSIFRQSTTMGPDGKRINPADDLDYFVNARVYLEDDSTVIGATKIVEPDQKARAVIVRFGDLMALSPTKADAFAVRGKSRFVIAMPDPIKNPSSGQLRRAIDELGVNMVPLDIFSDKTEDVKSLVDDYANMTYRPKPAAMRNIME